MTSILHTEASTGWGGQEIRTLLEAVHLTARGHRVLIAAPAESGLLARARAAGLPVRPVPFRRALDPRDLLAVLRLLRDEAVGILNTHSSKDSWTAAAAARLRRVPVVRTRHLSVPLRRSPLARLVYSRLADRIVTTGEAIREILIRDGGVDPGRVLSIPTGVDLTVFDPERADGTRVRQELGIPREAPLVGMVAVLRSWKGHPEFLEAIRQLRAAWPSCRGLVVGEGPYRPVVETEIRRLDLDGAVILTGHREDIREVLAALDVIVSASIGAEGVSQALVQALAMRRPVVATRVGSVHELIRDGETGLVVPPRDARALAEGIRTLLEDRGKAAELAARGRRLVEQTFSVDRMVERIEALHRELLAGRAYATP